MSRLASPEDLRRRIGAPQKENTTDTSFDDEANKHRSDGARFGDLVKKWAIASIVLFVLGGLSMALSLSGVRLR